MSDPLVVARRTGGSAHRCKVSDNGSLTVNEGIVMSNEHDSRSAQKERLRAIHRHLFEQRLPPSTVIGFDP
jgi:fido (protein-threonine AMPylation protein)